MVSSSHNKSNVTFKTGFAQHNLCSSIKDIVMELLKEAMDANVGDTKGFLIDGYPLEVKQAEEFESQVSSVTIKNSICNSARVQC